MNKQPVPAAISFAVNGELPPVEYNWVHVMKVCQEALTRDLDYVILPVEELQTFKPHRRRIVKEDKTSPKGLIQRDDYAKQRYYPYAAARFDAEELIRYAVQRFGSMSSDDVELMANEVLRGADQGDVE